MRVDGEQLEAEMKQDNSIDLSGYDGKIDDEGKAKAKRPQLTRRYRTKDPSNDEAMPQQHEPEYYLQCKAHPTTATTPGTPPGFPVEGQMTRSAGACTCKARALSIQPCFPEEAESLDEVVLHRAWLERARNFRMAKMRRMGERYKARDGGNDKGKGKERAHPAPTFGGSITADGCVKGLGAAAKYRARESSKHLAAAASARAEIDARTRMLKAAHMEKEQEKARRQEEVRRATERLIARENAVLVTGMNEEGNSDESSESVYDESSDDENPPSMVADIAEVDVRRNTSLVRLNSNTARSETAVVVEPQPKRCWMVWFRWVFCVPDGDVRRGKKLQKERRR